MGRNLFQTDNKTKTESIRSGRNLFENGGVEDESFINKLPRNLQIGLFQGRQGAVNLPHDVAQNLEQQGQQFGESINQALPLEKYIGSNKLPFSPNEPRKNFSEYLPYEQNDYAKLLGQKGEGTFMDKAIQKGVEYAPELITGINSIRKFLPHLTKRGATKTLNKAQKLAQEREIGTLNVDPELIEDARQFLPNILRNRKTLDSAQAGDYNSLFKLQSEVGQLAGQQAKSWFSPGERIKGRAGLESRGNLLDAIHQNLQSLGHQDISDLLKKGQNEYRKYMKFKKYRNALGLAGAAYAVPKNPLTDLVKNLVMHRNQ